MSTDLYGNQVAESVPDAPYKRPRVDLFKQLLPSILVTKEPVIDQENERDYDAYIVNRALSLHPDCLFIAEQMNRLHGLPSLLQYQYLMGKVRSQRRTYEQWPKKVKTDELKAVAWYFGYSLTKASMALDILSEEQITYIVQQHKDSGN